MIDVPEATRLLGRHVEGRPEERPRLGARRDAGRAGRRLDLRDAEVEHLGDVVVVVGLAHEEDVLGLEIAVDDALLVRAIERAAHLVDDPDRLLESEAVGVVQALVERLADQHLHDDVGAAVLRHPVVEDLDGVLRLDGRGGPRLVVESCPRVLAVGVLGLDELDGHARPERRVATLPDRAHAPTPYELDQLILARDEAGRRKIGRCGCHVRDESPLFYKLAWRSAPRPANPGPSRPRPRSLEELRGGEGRFTAGPRSRCRGGRTGWRP